jgi:hypothetical protein
VAILGPCFDLSTPFGFRVAGHHGAVSADSLVDPLDVPWSIVEQLADQIGVADASCVKRYADRPMTVHGDAKEIREEYGFPEGRYRVGAYQNVKLGYAALVIGGVLVRPPSPQGRWR